MIEPIIVFALCAWLIYRFYKTRKNFNLFALIFLLLFQLSKWPLHIPFTLSLSAMTFFACGLQVTDFYKSKGKTKNLNLILYAGVSFFLGVVFLLNFLFSPS